MSEPRKPPLFHEFQVEASALVFEVAAAAGALAAARTFRETPVIRADRVSQLLAAIERLGGAPTFSDLARLIGVSRQAARTFALAAANQGVVELFPCPDDRRAWQVMLTPKGRVALEAARMPEFTWLFMLLRGLEVDAMRRTAHVLRVIRLRLERDERGRRVVGQPLAPRR